MRNQTKVRQDLQLVLYWLFKSYFGSLGSFEIENKTMSEAGLDKHKNI